MIVAHRLQVRVVLCFVGVSNRLDAKDLYRRCDVSTFAFETTRELEPIPRIGQERAIAALRFGLGMRHEGYNLYAMGPSGTGKYTAVHDAIAQRAIEDPTPPDLCYVYDFASPHTPRALRLPAGKGRELQRSLEKFVEDLHTTIPAALDTDEYRVRKQALEDEIKTKQDAAFEALRERVAKEDLALLQTPVGFTLAAVKKGELVSPDDFEKLPEEERDELRKRMESFGGELRKLLESIPRFHHIHHEKLLELIRETIMKAARHLLDDAKKIWSGLPDVIAHLTAIERDVLENAADFSKRDESSPFEPSDRFMRYRVNLLVDHADAKGASIVFEDHPTYENLVGRIEHTAQLGALVTDFTLVKAGALHRASGGYLLLDAHNLLVAPYAWDGLKRALFGKQVRIESLGAALGFASTVSLEPRPIPLDVKVVLIGERQLFYLLEAFDPDFRALFKVVVDFEEEVDRTSQNDARYAQLVAAIARDEKLRPFDRSGVARVIEQMARVAEDAEKLSTHMGSIVDLAREANYWASERGGEVVTSRDVARAVDAERQRADRVYVRVLEDIRRETLMIETKGSRVGQVNGLSVFELGGFAFGRPSRITARVRVGTGDVVDIERAATLGGPIHSKGVLILTALLGARYARGFPLSLAATIAFEQSYGVVEGDSASRAELYALISSLAEVPVKQSVAITGSVDQHGDVQPIGGVNEKIEGFFDVCKARGLTGEQGVIIPRANVKHLMLREDVVEAVRARTFSVWAISTIDEGVAILTGMSAGERDAAGEFPSASINAMVETRLAAFARLRQRFGTPSDRARFDALEHAKR